MATLTGSEKQVAWAEKIRAGVQDKADRILAVIIEKHILSGEALRMATEAVDVVCASQKASEYIDNRNNSISRWVSTSIARALKLPHPWYPGFLNDPTPENVTAYCACERIELVESLIRDREADLRDLDGVPLQPVNVHGEIMYPLQ